MLQEIGTETALDQKIICKSHNSFFDFNSVHCSDSISQMLGLLAIIVNLDPFRAKSPDLSGRVAYGVRRNRGRA